MVITGIVGVIVTRGKKTRKQERERWKLGLLKKRGKMLNS